MSRINRNKKQTTIADGTSNQTVYNKGVSKKGNKKVGHKGDNARVNFNSPFISVVQSGGGTESNPYLYTLNVKDTIVNSIANNKAKLLEQMEESKGLNDLVNSVQLKHLKMLKGFDSTCSFNVDLKDLSLKVTNIANATEKNIGVSKFVPTQKTKQNTVNNLFYVGGNFNLPINCTIKHSLKIEGKDDIHPDNPNPCEYGYKVHVNKGGDGSSFSFFITYKKLPMTYDYLTEKIITKMKKISIDFLIEYNNAKGSSTLSRGSVSTGTNTSSMGGGY